MRIRMQKKVANTRNGTSAKLDVRENKTMLILNLYWFKFKIEMFDKQTTQMLLSSLGRLAADS